MNLREIATSDELSIKLAGIIVGPNEPLRGNHWSEIIYDDETIRPLVREVVETETFTEQLLREQEEQMLNQLLGDRDRLETERATLERVDTPEGRRLREAFAEAGVAYGGPTNTAYTPRVNVDDHVDAIRRRIGAKAITYLGKIIDSVTRASIVADISRILEEYDEENPGMGESVRHADINVSPGNNNAISIFVNFELESGSPRNITVPIGSMF